MRAVCARGGGVGGLGVDDAGPVKSGTLAVRDTCHATCETREIAFRTPQCAVRALWCFDRLQKRGPMSGRFWQYDERQCRAGVLARG